MKVDGNESNMSSKFSGSNEQVEGIGSSVSDKEDESSFRSSGSNNRNEAEKKDFEKGTKDSQRK